MTVRARVIPCLDVAGGRVVKGVNFVDLKDAGDPVEQARAYDAAGADELCFLDIGASHEGRDTIVDVVRRTATRANHSATVVRLGVLQRSSMGAPCLGMVLSRQRAHAPQTSWKRASSHRHVSRPRTV